MVSSLVFILSGLCIFTGLYTFTAACSITNECSSNNEICATTGSCECKSGFSRSKNGTCVIKGDEASSKSLYTILVVVLSTLIILLLLSLCLFVLLYRKKVKCLFCIQRDDEGEERLQMTSLKHKPSIRQILGEYDQLSHNRPADNTWTDEDFKKLVQSLREDAPVFLKMINEVKKKLNMLEDKTTNQGVQYKALIRDLSRVLRLLNTKPMRLQMPVDGVPLLLWAENALKRFEKSDLQNPKITNEIGETSAEMRLKDAVL
ncbi:uncharacterized protein LOC114541698 isoform X2 [Dendronephthya gigantea]|uniref:uncharacterized protein LOC114541698 isoform X2 n=2 Tax=Dendronephthya gigantea TaxID=151771 RepID=UPI00106AFCF3|nr:uncharacterized protein LOC114541698 isoform X2 [Dendronephthya gigantea]